MNLISKTALGYGIIRLNKGDIEEKTKDEDRICLPGHKNSYGFDQTRKNYMYKKCNSIKWQIYSVLILDC